MVIFLKKSYAEVFWLKTAQKMVKNDLFCVFLRHLTLPEGGQHLVGKLLHRG